MTAPRELGRDLRSRTTPAPRRRRWVVGLSLLGVTMGQIVALFQTGIVRRGGDEDVTEFAARREAEDLRRRETGAAIPPAGR